MLPYLELMRACNLRESIERNVQARSGGRGWTDSENCITLILLNLAGGDCVNDLRTLESDEGFCRLLKSALESDLDAHERRMRQRRWRRETDCTTAATSSMYRYLESFHDLVFRLALTGRSRIHIIREVLIRLFAPWSGRG